MGFYVIIRKVWLVERGKQMVWLYWKSGYVFSSRSFPFGFVIIYWEKYALSECLLIHNGVIFLYFSHVHSSTYTIMFYIHFFTCSYTQFGFSSRNDWREKTYYVWKKWTPGSGVFRIFFRNKYSSYVTQASQVCAILVSGRCIGLGIPRYVTYFFFHYGKQDDLIRPSAFSLFFFLPFFLFSRRITFVTIMKGDTICIPESQEIPVYQTERSCEYVTLTKVC